MAKMNASVLSYIELSGLGDLTKHDPQAVTQVMTKVHWLMDRCMTLDFKHQNYCYLLNDAVLLISEVEPSSVNNDFDSVIREVQQLKYEINELCTCRVVVIKEDSLPSVAMPTAALESNGNTQARTTCRVMTSAFAIENCMDIASQLGQENGSSWLVDSRLACSITTRQKYDKHLITMRPKNKERNIYVYSGDLW